MKNRSLINWFGLAGIIQLLSYTAAVIFSPLAFSGYDWMSQAVSDLSADSAPSRQLWDQLSALYGTCSIICMVCVVLYISQNKTGSRLFRAGVYLYAVMTFISKVGYSMFPLSDSGKDITTVNEVIHMVVTAAVVLMSIASLVILMIAGFRKGGIRSISLFAAVALAMMFVGAIGMKAVPPEYFGIVERFSVFAAVGFTAVLGTYLFMGDKLLVSTAPAVSAA
ncbi:MAG: DUF998 domain-containing protein [Oscillospiraceae bacterium]|nr:DUF998 domain-containing protein [Oscillospiraceae bacterium]